MTGVERAPLNVATPRTPHADRPGLLDVPDAECPLGAPQDQERAGDAAPAGMIRLVVLAVDGRGGPVLLTYRVGVSRVAEGLDVGRTNLGRESRRGEPHAPSALSMMASAAVARMCSGSGSGWASSDHGQ